MIDGSLARVQAQVEESVSALGGDLSAQLSRAEMQSAGRFSTLTNIVQQKGDSLRDAINSVAATQLTNQDQLTSSLRGLREQNSQLHASLDSHSAAIMTSVESQGELTRLHSEEQTERLEAAYAVGVETLERGQAALSQQLTESTAATLQALSVVTSNVKAVRKEVLANRHAITDVTASLANLGKEFASMTAQNSAVQVCRKPMRVPRDWSMPFPFVLRSYSVCPPHVHTVMAIPNDTKSPHPSPPALHMPLTTLPADAVPARAHASVHPACSDAHRGAGSGVLPVGRKRRSRCQPGRVRAHV